VYIYTEKRKKNTQLRELSGLESVSLVIRRSRNVECKDDVGWWKLGELNKKGGDIVLACRVKMLSLESKETEN